MARVAAWADRVGVDIDDEVRKAMKSVTGDASGLAHGSIMAIIQGVVAFFISFHILRDRAALLARPATTYYP